MSKFPHRLADFHISSVKSGTSCHYTRKIWNRCQNLSYFSIIMTLSAVQQPILCFLNCQTFLNWLSASRLENLCRKPEPDVIALLCSIHPACRCEYCNFSKIFLFSIILLSGAFNTGCYLNAHGRKTINQPTNHASITSPLVSIYWPRSSKSRNSGITYQDFKQSVACVALYPRLLRQGFATFPVFENSASDGVELAQTEKISWTIFAKTGNHIPLALTSVVVPGPTDLRLQR